MDAWMRGTHRSTSRVLDAMGIAYAIPGTGGACCGALHAHAGLHHQADKMARAVIGSMPGDAPILVNSAGCGAALKEYGHLFGTEEARAFSARVYDVHEYVAEHAARLPELRHTGEPIIVHDPCHLRHVQRVHEPVRALLERVGTVIELDDAGLCCGAGGAYSMVEPELSGEIRDLKLDTFDRAIAVSGAAVAASANPGCAMHLADGLAERGVAVRHPIDILADALPEGE
jgi:glycolate oxidase iron-sulfur subunit